MPEELGQNLVRGKNEGAGGLQSFKGCILYYIFTVFVHFFSIIEGRAVVIQPPQLA